MGSILLFDPIPDQKDELTRFLPFSLEIESALSAFSSDKFGLLLAGPIIILHTHWKMIPLKEYDTVILGAGASGLMCASSAGGRGQRVLVLDHAPLPGRKLLLSGGGRCNFTNRLVQPDNYISRNPHFCKSALSRYTNSDFMNFIRRHTIPFEERESGRLFCAGSAQLVLDALLSDCAAAGVRIMTGCAVRSAAAAAPEQLFSVYTSVGNFSSRSLVVATGGLSWPQGGASDLGFRIAEQFGHRVFPCFPALVPLALHENESRLFGDLQGISLEVSIRCGEKLFRENLLFTHRGLSGPVVLQISNYWKKGERISIDFLPGGDIHESFRKWKAERPRAELKTLLGELLPRRLADRLSERMEIPNRQVAQLSSRELERIALMIHNFTCIPSGTLGFKTAEVTAGGVDTSGISSRTFESAKVPGLYFIGEVLDVTGELGGYNLQWAWSSGYCAGECV